MSAWFRTASTALTAIFRRFPFIMGTFRVMNNKARSIREFRSIHSLLAELNSDTALQLPLLVEQNRKMFREIEQLRTEVARLKDVIEKR